jgi:hypothetical protein
MCHKFANTISQALFLCQDPTWGLCIYIWVALEDQTPHLLDSTTYFIVNSILVLYLVSNASPQQKIPQFAIQDLQTPM